MKAAREARLGRELATFILSALETEWRKDESNEFDEVATAYNNCADDLRDALKRVKEEK